jgi:hypothetical protein
MRMPNHRAARALRAPDIRLPILAAAVVASITVFLSSATDGETSSDATAIITVAPSTSALAQKQAVPASAVPLIVAETSTSTTAAAPAVPAEVALAPTTTATANGPLGAARQSPATTTPPPPESDVATPPPPVVTTPPAPPVAAAAKPCAVRLHGKGGGGSGTYRSGAVTYLAPTGNAAGWSGRQWLYFPDSAYRDAVAVVASAIDAEGCTRVIVDGFSNGAAFAAKLHCRGETFGGRLAGVIIDDPVTDHAVTGCAPASGVAVTLYWTGALAGSGPGWDCGSADWTCDGGSTIGIAAYTAALGTPAKASPNSGHSPYADPPELVRF